MISRSRCQDDVSGNFWKHPPLRRRLRDLHPAYFRLVGPSYPRRSWPLCCQSCVTSSFEVVFICYTSLHWKFCPSTWIGLTDVYHLTNQFVLHFRMNLAVPSIRDTPFFIQIWRSFSIEPMLTWGYPILGNFHLKCHIPTPHLSEKGTGIQLSRRTWVSRHREIYLSLGYQWRMENYGNLTISMENYGNLTMGYSWNVMASPFECISYRPIYTYKVVPPSDVIVSL